MKSSLALVTLGLVLVSLSPSLAQTRCCTYRQWEGQIYSKYAVYNQLQNTAVVYDLDIQTHTDYDKNKVYVDEKLVDVAHPTPVFVKTLLDYNQGIQYIVTQGQCTKKAITTPLVPGCVPASAQYLGRNSFAEVNADTWAFTDPSTVKINYRSTVSVENCVPIQTVRTEMGDVLTLMTSDYMNVTQGIVDPSVFNIPPECKQTVNDLPLMSHLHNDKHIVQFHIPNDRN